MEQKYIINEQELNERGLQISEYVVATTFIPAIINLALDMAITRIFALNDSIKSVKDIEDILEKDTDKQLAFKKLQYRVIYNLIFLGNNDPLDKSVDDIISGDLRLTAINGYQKRIWGNYR